MANEGPTLIELEARLARLEERLGAEPGRPDTNPTDANEPTNGTGPAGPMETAGPTETAGPVDEADVFWALNGLKRRLPRPAVVYTGVARSVDGGLVEWQMGHDSEVLLDEDWRSSAPVLAALGHPSRLQILQLIARGDASTAADLAHADGLGTTGQIYHHLRQLVSAGWLRSTTKGRHQIPPERLVPLLVILGASG